MNCMTQDPDLMELSFILVCADGETENLLLQHIFISVALTNTPRRELK